LPGTAGTLLAIPLSLALNRIAVSSISISLLTLVVFILMAAWFAERAEEIFQERDCQRIVIDEIAGFLLANFLSPARFETLAMAFLLFRFFDIMKIAPANRAGQIKGGTGVVMDDLVAGLYTFLILRLVFSLGLL
jgi:phosphatidylglycerophosphatase A